MSSRAKQNVRRSESEKARYAYRRHSTRQNPTADRNTDQRRRFCNRSPLFHCAHAQSRASTYHRFMLNLSRRQWAGGWLALVVTCGAVASIAGVRLTAADGLLLLVAGLAPVAIMLHVWRGPPPPTVAEVMYAAKSNRTGGKP